MLYIILIIIIIIIIIKNLKMFEGYEDYTISGDEIYIKLPNGAESSRFNYKTKESKHWYNLEMINEINKIKKDNLKVLMLGVALGGIAVHLLDKNKSINITGVDISDKYFNIVKKYADNTRLNLIKMDANKYNNNEKFDIIICDIFMNSTVPDFVLTKEFMDNIYKMLLPKGKFLMNTINVNKEKLHNLIKNSFPNSTIEDKQKNGNYLIFITLN